MEKTKTFLYVHIFLENSKGVIKTIKVNLENGLNISVIDLKHLISKTLTLKKENGLKVVSLSKTIQSKSLLDSIKLNYFFENKDEVFCQVEMNIQPIKTTTNNIQNSNEDLLSFKTLNKYSFYEANKQVMKVLVPIPGISGIAKENIKAIFKDFSFEVKVYGVKGVNYMFAVPRLDAQIVPEKSEALTDKNDNLVIRLRKFKDDDHWSYLFKVSYAGES